MLESIRSVPGIISVGATSSIPLGGDFREGVILAEGHVMKPGESVISPTSLAVPPGYFETLHIALVSGRTFTDANNNSSPRVVIVDEKLARHSWPNRDPVGQRMNQPDDPSNLMKTGPKTRWLSVLRIVDTTRLESLADTGTSPGAYYFPYAQSPSRTFAFAIQTALKTNAIEHILRAQIARIDPDLALFDVRSIALGSTTSGLRNWSSAKVLSSSVPGSFLDLPVPPRCAK